MARFHLVTLGRLALVDSSGVEDELGKRRRKLALLAVLALARRPISRDTLVDTFWGEEPEEKARHSLSDALSHLRRVLGRDAILSRQTEVALTTDTALTVDAIQLTTAAAAGDHPRVVELYQGQFLDGVYVPESPRFEEWSARERARLERLFVTSCTALCHISASAENWNECARLATRWLDVDAGSREAAQFLATANAAAPMLPVPRSAPRPDTASPESRMPVRSPRALRWRIAAVIVGIAGIVASGLWSTKNRGVTSTDPARQVVAIVDVRVAPADPSLAWLQDGFAMMIAADLSRTATFEVVSASRVQSLLARANRAATTLDGVAAADVASRLDARWAVTATLSHVGSSYLVQLTVQDVHGGAARSFAISGANVLTVADQAAARVRSVAAATAPGPQLADVETDNVAAFEHFVRANQAGDEGRLADQLSEIDAAVAADSGFTSALVARMRIARFYVDTITLARLAGAYARASSRLTRWDDLEQAQYLAMHNGEHARAEQLARDLVAAYPHDPRAYQTLATTLSMHGQWAAADSVLRRALRLDSLAIAAGRGPCVPCATYSGLVDNAVAVGHLADAERDARRWLALQPDLPAAWAALATVQASSGQFDVALESERHASELSGDDAGYEIRIGRILVMARRLGAVDSLIRQWQHGTREYRIGALDLQSVVERERGQFRASDHTLKQALDEFHDGGLELVRLNGLARSRRYDDARRDFERVTPHGLPAEPASPVQSLAGDRARTFAWHHALEADAIAPRGDTIYLRALADSIERIGTRSYFARDWRIFHHVRGLIALAAGRPDEASREFVQAEFGAAGWTRTNALLAESYLSMGNAPAALAALRTAYQAAPDAMGRYQPRSELDYLMARAFNAANAPDSARVYARYAIDAWANADPEGGARRKEMTELLAATKSRSP